MIVPLYASNSEGNSGLVACGAGISIQAESARNCLRDGIAVRPLLDPADPIPTVAAWAKANTSPVIPLLLDVPS